MNKLNITSYNEIQEALIQSTSQYLNPPKGCSLPGLFHGKKGRCRAIKAQLFAKAIPPQNEIALLCLSLAIIDSNSNGLATIMACLLIRGSYRSTTTMARTHVFNNLNSSVFTQDILERARQERNNCTITGGKGCASTIFNHRSGARWILQQELDNTEDNADLHATISAMKKNLEDTSSQDIDCSLIPSCELKAVGTQAMTQLEATKTCSSL